ncbi:hypothetical protein JHD50_05030 [Sulfurimonas sp. MAG313]|nr:hypothetical protein [Sulfurimonas sp. MAG313]MDF1880673.1 hypothetical protein [Sulfurimonas sp. MAG313]
MQADKSLEFKSAIITLKELNDGTLVVMSKNGDLRCLNTFSHKTISGFKTNIEQERSSGQYMSMSACGKYAACVLSQSPNAVVFDVPSKIVLHTTSGHKGDIECVCVDDNSRYIVTGGTDGRTYVYDIISNLLIFSFPPHADYIASLAINDFHILSASYDKSISVLNLDTMKTPSKLRGHSAVIVQMVFLKDMQMLSADKEGNILVWDLKTASLLRRLPKANDDITCLCVSKDETFLFLGSKLGYVFLYDLEKGIILMSSFIKEDSKICSLALIEHKQEIVVGTKTGKLSFYPLLPDEDFLITQVKSKQYLSLYKQAQDNPILSYSPIFHQLESLWESSLSKATELLEREQKSNAEMILEPFKGVPIKSTIIKDLLKDYQEFNKFKQHILNKKYSLAYPIASLHPNFKKTEVYQSMEADWHLKFNKAKMYIMEKEGEVKVRKYLNDFRGISQKSILIQELYTQRTAYMLFKRKLAQKDYVSLFALIEKCPFIKEFDEYDELLDYVNGIYIKATKALDKKQYPKVLEFASILSYFPEFKNEASIMIKNTKLIKSFLELYADRNLNAMYTCIAESPFLLELSEAKELNDDWNEHLNLAQKFASKADVVNVVASLEDFFDIKTKHLNIALVVQQAYIAQFYRGVRANKSQVMIENGVKQYLIFLGIDESIEEFVQAFKDKYPSTLDIQICEHGDINLFKPYMIISEIII